MSLLRNIKAGSLIVEKNIFLAPLAGIGDCSFRRIGRCFGAGLTFTEMVSANGLVMKNHHSAELCTIAEDERPAGIQLFGSDPGKMGEAAGLASGIYRPDCIDINAGCSVKKILKDGAGAALLENPEKFYRIVKSVVEHSIVPVTVKIRLGMSDGRINVVENALAAEEAGAVLLTLHPRTAADKFVRPARWEYIGIVKERLQIPVCGNGDIRTHEDAVRMIRNTGCDAVMVGRAVVGNPWIIRDIAEAFKYYPGEYVPRKPAISQRARLALLHMKMVCRQKGETRGIREMKRILPHYIKGVPGAAKLRDRLVRVDNMEEVKKFLRKLLEV